MSINLKPHLRVGEQISQLEEYTQADTNGTQANGNGNRETVLKTVAGFGIPGYEVDEDGAEVVFEYEDDEPKQKPFKQQFFEGELRFRMKIRTAVKSEWWFWGVLFLGMLFQELKRGLNFLISSKYFKSVGKHDSPLHNLSWYA